MFHYMLYLYCEERKHSKRVAQVQNNGIKYKRIENFKRLSKRRMQK